MHSRQLGEGLEKGARYYRCQYYYACVIVVMAHDPRSTSRRASFFFVCVWCSVTVTETAKNKHNSTSVPRKGWELCFLFGLELCCKKVGGFAKQKQNKDFLIHKL